MKDLITDLSLILAVGAVFSVLSIVLKQPIVLAYIFSGVAIGPWGLGWIHRADFIASLSHLGITLLLFLAGLNLHPQKLVRVFRQVSLVTAANALFSFLTAFAAARAFHFATPDALGIGLAMMFSSTVLVVKLLPTTDLHHRHIGAVCIGVLILQDLMAVGVLAFLRCLEGADWMQTAQRFLLLNVKLAVLIGILLFFEHYVLRKLMKRVELFHEALFVLGLAWCFGIATLSDTMGLFYETGAFFSGVVLARHGIATFIAESLKPLRDFFLLLFFFTLGAGLDLGMLGQAAAPALLLAAVFTVARPYVFKKAFMVSGENAAFSKEAGMRLGQLSEFSLLVALLGLELGHLTRGAAQLIQLTTILTFIVSSYGVFRAYPTPIGGGSLKQD